MINKKTESIVYIAATYLITYACWGFLALLGLTASVNTLSTILYILGGFSTTLVALLIPLLAPRSERGSYYKRFFRFGIPLKWYVFPIVPSVIMTFLSYGIIVLFFSPVAEGLKIQPLYMIVPLFFMMIFGGGIEEFGWRGIVVHNLRNLNPILISLGVGFVWGCWHIPLFFIKGTTQYNNYFVPFLISVLAFSFITTALYLISGSVIPCIIAHAMFGAVGGLGFWYGTNEPAAYVDSIIRLLVAVIFFSILMRHYRGRKQNGEQLICSKTYYS